VSIINKVTLHAQVSQLEKTKQTLLEIAHQEHNIYLRRCAEDLDLVIKQLENTLVRINTT